jgi:hypothetical protein
MKAVPPTFLLKRDWRRFVWIFAAITAAALLFGPGSWGGKTFCVLFGCGLTYAMIALCARDSRRSPEKLRAALFQAAPEVYFGHDGIFCNGVYTTWLSLNVYLLAASIDERQPRSLLFRFEKVAPGPYSGSQAAPFYQFVLIPAGAESDLAHLQQNLSARCPKARINLC